MSKFATRPGNKYYRVLDDGTVDVVRIIRHKNVETLVCVDDNEYDGVSRHRYYTVKKEELLSKYRLLLPHGQVVLMNCKSDMGVRDVVVVATRIDSASDINDQNTITFGQIEVVCRQWLVDFLAHITEHSGKTVMGLSINRASCPTNVNFDNLTSDCKIINDQAQFISIYRQDTLDQILGLLRTIPSDEILSTYYTTYNDPNVRNTIVGLCPNTKALMEKNGFLTDIRMMFGIAPVRIKVKYDENSNSYILSNTEVAQLEYTLKATMSDILIFPDDIYLDEDKLSKDYTHTRICDETGKLYVVQYTATSEFNPELYPKEVLEDISMPDSFDPWAK